MLTALATHVNVQAPPATVFLHLLQCQIPTHFLFIASYIAREYKLYVLRCDQLLWYLSTEETDVLCVLANFYFLHHLSEWCAISRAILANYSYFLGTFRLNKYINNSINKRTFHFPTLLNEKSNYTVVNYDCYW